MADLQRKYRSLERRRDEPTTMIVPKVPRWPERIFYRILDEETRRKKKHVKFQLLGEEDEETKRKSMQYFERSPIPARYRASVARDADPSIPHPGISFTP